MLPVKKTSFQPKEKTTEAKSTADNPIQAGSRKTQEKTPSKKTSAITAQPISLETGLPSGADLGNDPISTHLDQGLLPNLILEPYQEVDLRQDPSRATSSAHSSSPIMQATTSASTVDQPSSPSQVQNWDAKSIAQRILTLKNDNQSITILTQIQKTIENDANDAKFYTPSEIDKIVKALVTLKIPLATNIILIALKPHISQSVDTLNPAMIRSIFNCLTAVSAHKEKWEISLILLKRIKKLTLNRLINESNSLSLGGISGSLQGLIAVTHLGETQQADIEFLVDVLTQHLTYQASKGKYFNLQSIIYTFYALNGTINFSNSAIEKLLKYLVERLTIEMGSVTNFQDFAYILHGLEGKVLSDTVKTILTNMLKIEYTALTKITNKNIVLAIGGLRTLAESTQAQKLLTNLLTLCQTYPITEKINVFTLLYTLTPYANNRDIIAIASNSSERLINLKNKDLGELFKKGLSSLTDILPYLATAQISKIRPDYILGSFSPGHLTLNLHDCTHSLAKALCIQTIRTEFLPHLIYTQLIIIIGQATGEERNIAVMLDIATSVSKLFPDLEKPIHDSTNAGRLIITRKPKPSANSSSAPDA